MPYGTPTVLIINSTPIVGGTPGEILFVGAGNVIDEDPALFWDNTNKQLQLTTTGSGAGILIGGDTQFYRSAANIITTPDSLVIEGNTTFGNASGDNVTYNAATVTYNNNITFNRAGGTVNAGVVNLITEAESATGDAGGTSDIRAKALSLTLAGSNNIAAAYGSLQNFVHSGSGVLASANGHSMSMQSTSTGATTTSTGFLSIHALSSSGGITTARGFHNSAPLLTSTGAITNLFGHSTGDLGHASLITNAIGFDSNNFTAGPAFSANFRAQQNSGSGKWGFIATGTANNAFAGNVRIGSNVAPSNALDVTGIIAGSNKIYPGTDAAAAQSVSGLYAGNGAPNNANGSNGDFYFRGDGTQAGNTVIYHKEAGAWVALVTT